MHYHIILTEKCNLQCQYCYEKSLQEFENSLEKKFTFDYSDPCTSQVNIQKLKTFIQKDEAPTIIFYGGEPLLQISKIKEIMDALPKVPFRMQTNGQLLHLLEPKYLNQITKILISIDGKKEITNKYRGEGTYEKVVENIRLIRKNGYPGELIARMTVAQDNPNIYKNVKDLLETKLFDSVHWQLDAGFYETDFEPEKIKKFFSKYNESISKLVKFWIEELKKENLIRLYPFIGIASRLLGLDKETKIMCGAGHSGYAITTSGKVVACPIMNNIKEFECGNLDTNPKDLKKILVTDKITKLNKSGDSLCPPPTSEASHRLPAKRPDCSDCESYNLCGGRCLYWRKASLWPKEGNDLICNSVKHLISELKNNLTEIEKSNLNYEKYFGPEIIP